MRGSSSPVTGTNAAVARQGGANPAANAVVFTGYVERATLSAMYDDAAVFAMPSRGEGFGLVYLEAMAHRRACIGSVHDAAGDEIVEGVTGYLVDQRDTAMLAEQSWRGCFTIAVARGWEKRGSAAVGALHVRSVHGTAASRDRRIAGARRAGRVSAVRVLHVIPAVAPRYGGPSSSIVEMCRALNAQGVETLLATTDADGDSRLDVELGREVCWHGIETIFFRRRVERGVQILARAGALATRARRRV